MVILALFIFPFSHSRLAASYNTQRTQAAITWQSYAGSLSRFILPLCAYTLFIPHRWHPRCRRYDTQLRQPTDNAHVLYICLPSYSLRRASIIVLQLNNYRIFFLPYFSILLTSVLLRLGDHRSSSVTAVHTISPISPHLCQSLISLSSPVSFSSTTLSQHPS